MKRYLLLFWILSVPLAIVAQEKPVNMRYDPGKWYAGLRLESYWFAANSDLFRQKTEVPPSAFGFGFNAWFGHHLTRHVDVQVGAFFNINGGNNNVQAVYSRIVNDTLTYQENRFLGKNPLYLPLVVKLTPFGNHRRVQPYLLAGVSMAVGRKYKTTREYDPNRTMLVPGPPDYYMPLTYNRTTEKEGLKAVFGAYVGIGLKVRVVHRVSMALDGAFGRNLSRGGSVTANGGIGFLYDFASTK